jgi:hypothetical protein
MADQREPLAEAQRDRPALSPKPSSAIFCGQNIIIHVPDYRIDRPQLNKSVGNINTPVLVSPRPLHITDPLSLDLRLRLV